MPKLCHAILTHIRASRSTLLIMHATGMRAQRWLVDKQVANTHTFLELQEAHNAKQYEGDTVADHEAN